MGAEDVSTLSRAELPKFEYLRPRSIEEAVSLLVKHGEEAQLLAGGTDLIVLIRSGALTRKYIVDIGGISGLDYVEYKEDLGLRIGALATVRAVGQSEAVERKYPLLHEAVRQMAHPQIRNNGTLAGNICRASPAADGIPPLLVLNASVKIAGLDGTRSVPLGQFFAGPGQTVLKRQDIVTEIQVPELPSASGTAFLRATRVASDLAKVNVASVLVMNGGVCEDARIALGSVAPTPIRARKAEEVLRGKNLKEGLIEEAAGVAADETRPITDVRSTAEYRKELAKVLVKRALTASWERAREKIGG